MPMHSNSGSTASYNIAPRAWSCIRYKEEGRKSRVHLYTAIMLCEVPLKLTLWFYCYAKENISTKLTVVPVKSTSWHRD